MKPDLRYWDACCFIGWLKGEEDKKPSCGPIIEAACAGRIIIVTSALTLAEAFKLKGLEPVAEKDRDKLQQFFKNEYIRVQNVDRFIAESAANLLFSYPVLKPKDSIHLATALRLKIPAFDTFDTELIKLAGHFASENIVIGCPSIQFQSNLPFS